MDDDFTWLDDEPPLTWADVPKIVGWVTLLIFLITAAFLGLMLVAAVGA